MFHSHFSLDRLDVIILNWIVGGPKNSALQTIRMFYLCCLHQLQSDRTQPQPPISKFPLPN